MALHPLSLPPSATLLAAVVDLLRTLLRELAEPALVPATVNTAWVRSVWPGQAPEWVNKFCGRNQIARIQVLANAPAAVRLAIYDEFCRQNDFKTVFVAGGDFRDFTTLLAGDAALETAISDFFKKCYDLLGENNNAGWRGYEFAGGHVVSKGTYREDFCNIAPTREVCPYCDGSIGTPELDHYLWKDGFPFLACSPQNLFPACGSCNEVATAKGNRPALTLGPPRSMNDWLHPLFRPATEQVSIQLTGPRQSAIPRLHSPDPVEQTRLNNHENLVRTLAPRWTKRAAAKLDGFVTKFVAERQRRPNLSVDAFVRRQLRDFVAVRGTESFTLIDSAVCRAVLENRPGWRAEFANPNPLGMS